MFRENQFKLMVWYYKSELWVAVRRAVAGCGSDHPRLGVPLTLGLGSSLLGVWEAEWPC